jgi:hypothetical protein
MWGVQTTHTPFTALPGSSRSWHNRSSFSILWLITLCHLLSLPANSDIWKADWQMGDTIQKQKRLRATLRNVGSSREGDFYSKFWDRPDREDSNKTTLDRGWQLKVTSGTINLLDSYILHKEKLRSRELPAEATYNHGKFGNLSCCPSCLQLSFPITSLFLLALSCLK